MLGVEGERLSHWDRHGVRRLLPYGDLDLLVGDKWVTRFCRQKWILGIHSSPGTIGSQHFLNEWWSNEWMIGHSAYSPSALSDQTLVNILCAASFKNHFTVLSLKHRACSALQSSRGTNNPPYLSAFGAASGNLLQQQELADNTILHVSWESLYFALFCTWKWAGTRLSRTAPLDWAVWDPRDAGLGGGGGRKPALGARLDLSPSLLCDPGYVIGAHCT